MAYILDLKSLPGWRKIEPYVPKGPGRSLNNIPLNIPRLANALINSYGMSAAMQSQGTGYYLDQLRGELDYRRRWGLM